MYNEPFGPDFDKDTRRLYNLARELQVGYRLHFEEGPNTWYVSIVSSAPSEEITTKSWSLCSVMDLAIQHLEQLKNTNKAAFPVTEATQGMPESMRHEIKERRHEN